MTLTTRLSAFFLGVLACVLAGLSLLLLWVAERHLFGRVDDRLQAALATLIAAAEVSEDGIEWEPHERQLLLSDEVGGPICWIVSDKSGQRIDGSREPIPESGPPIGSLRGSGYCALYDMVTLSGQSWCVALCSIPNRPEHESFANPKLLPRQTPADETKHATLCFRVATSREPARVLLRNLTGLVASLALAFWIVAALVGKRLCRHALGPLSRMAQAASEIQGTEWGERLPLARRGDELEDLGRAFNGLLSRLQESFERQQRFTGDASHQLRTPLAILLGQVEVALRRERSAGEYRGVLGNVQAQAVRLHQIVEALLFLARADAEVEAPQFETVELRGWLQSHLRTWSDHPRFQDLRWEAGPEESLLIETHPPLLGELLDNLWDNACKYSDPGTPLSLGVQAASDACFISVKDAGCGITPEDLPHLFEPFYQSRAARQHGRAGVGLGLAVADRIARALGGGLQVTSTAGQGARFTLQLRRHPPQE